MSEAAIQVDHLSKKFASSLRRAMVYGLGDIATAALIPHRFRSAYLSSRLSEAVQPANNPTTQQPDNSSHALRPSEFWALRDISFEVARGECVGLVGANGAGKSTLFCILGGIYGPSSGRVVVRGRLQALIALGAGFHPMLSGRENIYINAAILGMSTRQIDALIDEIIDFSELHEFIDAPVKNYSSGMMVRLGFSVAAHLDPEILLIDEVLAVGDSRFQVKCQDYTRRLMTSGKAIMLVSHYMQNIQGLCSRAIWLDRGEMKMIGDVYEVTEAYQRHLHSSDASLGIRGREAAGGFAAHVEKMALTDARGQPVTRIQSGDSMRVDLTLASNVAVPCARFYVLVQSDRDGKTLFGANMLEDGHAVELKRGLNGLGVEFRSLALPAGGYRVYACVRSQDGVTAVSNGFLSPPFEVCASSMGCLNGAGPHSLVIGSMGSVARAEYRWFSDAMVGPLASPGGRGEVSSA